MKPHRERQRREPNHACRVHTSVPPESRRVGRPFVFSRNSPAFIRKMQAPFDAHLAQRHPPIQCRSAITHPRLHHNDDPLHALMMLNDHSEFSSVPNGTFALTGCSIPAQPKENSMKKFGYV